MGLLTPGIVPRGRFLYRMIVAWGGFLYRMPGGGLEKSEQGGSVYFLGSEIWLKFTFLGEKSIIIPLDCKF